MHRILCLATITVLAAGAQVVEKMFHSLNTHAAIGFRLILIDPAQNRQVKAHSGRDREQNAIGVDERESVTPRADREFRKGNGVAFGNRDYQLVRPDPGNAGGADPVDCEKATTALA